MPKTPRAAGREKPTDHHAWPSEVLAANVRAWRAVRGLSQGDLAERMTYLGLSWPRSILTRVEQATRTVSVDELLALALALEVPPMALLDVERAGARWLLLADDEELGPLAMTKEDAHHWLSAGAEASPVEWAGNDVVTFKAEES